MTGRILLAGGAEFGGGMADVDRAALAGIGPDAPVRIIPTAAAADNNHERAGRNGVRWFRHLGAQDVASVPVIDTASANDPALAAELTAAGMIYMLGGFPGFLAETLSGSACWQAIRAAYERGAVVAGSSAGAMVLCEHFYDPGRSATRPGLGLLPNCCVLPHHNGFGKRWASQLLAALPAATLVGIDEATGIIGQHTPVHGWQWQCFGPGAVTLYRDGRQEVYRANDSFSFA